MVMEFAHSHRWLMDVLMVFVVDVFVRVQHIVQVFVFVGLGLEGELYDRQ